MVKSKAPKPPTDNKTADGGALGRARQFAASRGLPMPQVECAEPAPARKKKPAPAPRKKPAR